MKLTHITSEPCYEQIKKEGFKVVNVMKGHFKPAGVWLSIDNDWERWCGINEFKKDKDTVCIEVELKNIDGFYTIDSLEDFNALLDVYCEVTGVKCDGEMRSIMNAEPFWKWTQTKYRGIILTSKGEMKTRFPTFMYGWDCASVCVFHPEDIKIKGAVII